MKALHLVVLASAALAAIAVVPTAGAVDLYCVVGDGDPACRDQLACTKNTLPRVCVRDPCATTHCIGAAAPSAAPTCWHLAEGGAGQWNSYLCVDPKGAPTCVVYTEMRAEWGTSRSCLA